jgi:hypothetical protein
MSLINWSDPDEMLGLLLDFVTDEARTSHADRERSRFLGELSQLLGELADQAPVSAGQAARALGEIRTSQPEEFRSDPVIAHLEACIEELQRIASDHQGRER